MYADYRFKGSALKKNEDQTYKPTNETKYSWASHRVAQELHSELMKLPLSQLLAIKEHGIKDLAEYAENINEYMGQISKRKSAAD
jgi:hypothetical protein